MDKDDYEMIESSFMELNETLRSINENLKKIADSKERENRNLTEILGCLKRM